MIKICQYCGKEFETNWTDKIYCSKQCCREADKRRKRENYTRKKPKVDTEAVSELRMQGLGYSEIADALGITFNQVRHACKSVTNIKKCEWCGKEFITRRTESKYCSKGCYESARRVRDRKSEKEVMENILANIPSNFTYISHELINEGYCHTLLKLKCKKCGAVTEFKTAIGRKRYVCNKCKEIERQEKEKAKQEKEGERKLHKEWSLKHPGTPYGYNELKVCPICGKEFNTHYKSQIYCSDRCGRKAHKHNHGKVRERFSPDKIKDKITLKELAERDNNICQICGRPIDWHDYAIKDGVFIAGKNYPSLDHIIPCAKGGEHSWDNVQLAHFYCNTLKRDHIYER